MQTFFISVASVELKCVRASSFIQHRSDGSGFLSACEWALLHGIYIFDIS